MVEDPKARVAEFLQRFGHERNLTLPPLSEDGVGSIQRGSAIITIHVLAEKDVLLVLSKVAASPALDADKSKRLLEASFLETGDAAFALHPQTGDLYLRIFRGLPGLDYDEFEDIVQTMGSMADAWDDKFRSL